MNLRQFLVPLALIITVSGGAVLGGQAHAQEVGGPASKPATSRVALFDGAAEGKHPSQSNVTRSGMTPQELRTARAIYRANQRVARMEYNLWIGHEPLRPRWNAIPMMSSRYTNPKFYVPVYIYNR